MSRFPAIPRRVLLVLVGAIVVAAAFAGFWHWNHAAPRSATPALAIQSLAAKALYYNSAARPWLLKLRSDLLTAEDLDAGSERSRGLVQAVENPKLFRQLDRKYHFDVLLLVGDPSQYRPLIEHLLETKDWTLTYLDHTSLVYKRDTARPWQPADLDALATDIPGNAIVRRSLHKRPCGSWPFDAVRMRKYVWNGRRRSMTGRQRSWNGHAIYRMNRGEWTPALAGVNRALAIDADFLPALATKTQILFSTGKFGDAYNLSRRLIDAYPNDPGLLFYHAKICHEAHAFTDEIRTLRRLVECAEAESRPTSGYRIYLAQAYAKDGKAEPAIEEFNRALADADLPKEQRNFAEETLAQVKERAGLR